MLNEQTARPIVDTRHADAAYAWQVARVCGVTGLQNCADRDCELHWQDASLRLAPDAGVTDEMLHSLSAPVRLAPDSGVTDEMIDRAVRELGMSRTVAAHMLHQFAAWEANRPVPVDAAAFPIGSRAFVRDVDARTGDDVFTPVTVIGLAGTGHVRVVDVAAPGASYDMPVARLVRPAVDVMADEKAPGADFTHGTDFATAHDAHLRAAYAEPWDVVPTDDPGTGDPLTGAYGRTYAEGGWMLMQAARDLFGPYTGHCPILLFQVTTPEGRPYVHGVLGGCVLTHADTYDTWDGALRAMRHMIDATLTAEAGTGDAGGQAPKGWDKV